MTEESARAAVLERVQNVFRDVFDDDGLTITDATSAADISDWDSLMHITLCVALEREFDIRMNAVEIGALSNVGKLVDLLVRSSL